ncbi:MAG TPA: DinB family protein [Terriglobales bacterium]|nr:DinB family protein [Terriglobales bacterium]
MPHLAAVPGPDLCREMLQAYAVNDALNQFVLEHLDSRAWRARPLGHSGRNIAAIFAHVHNVRRKWLRLSAPHLKLPAQLDRNHCTQKQARTVLAESAARCSEMLAEALNAPQGRVETFLRDGWARPWHPGAAMFAYMITHDAHHRGQVCMLAHQLGFPLPIAVMSGMWNWEKLSKQCGFELASGSKTKSRTR